MKTSTPAVLFMSGEKKKKEIERNYSDETFYTDSSEDVRSKCKSAATLLQKRKQLRPIIGGTGNPYRSTTRMVSISSPSKNTVSLVGQKIISAKVLRVKQLQNELMDAQFQLNELTTENRLLRTLQKRSEMALKKYEGTQAELPQLIRSHNEEVRALKLKLKQAKTQNRELENRLKMRESELQVLREQHKHLLKLSKDKHLGEREQLQQQLEQKQELLKEQDKKVQMLTRKLMLEGKNFKHQLITECARHKTTAKELDVALDKVTQLESVLETKERFIAANLPRMHTTHQSVSLVSLGPPARIRFHQSRLKATMELTPVQEGHGMDKSSNEKNEDDDDDEEEEEEDDEDDDGASTDEEEREMLSLTQGNQGLSNQQNRQAHHTKKENQKTDGGNDEDDDEDEDDDYYEYTQESTRTSVSTDSHTYASKASTNLSTENVHRKSRDSRKDAEHKPYSTNKDPVRQRMQTGLQPENEKQCKTDEKKRRYSVGGDSGMNSEEQNSIAGRRGSLTEPGDDKKDKDLSFLSNLATEIERETFIRRNSVGRNAHAHAVSLSNMELVKSPIRKHVPHSDKYVEEDDTTNSSGNNEEPCKDETPEDEENACNISEMSVEEGRQHLKSINDTWEEIQNTIREETSKAQMMMEKYDEELKDAEFAMKQNAESYNKKHLLAALKAIDNGADPIDLSDDVKERRSSLSSLSTKKTDSQKSHSSDVHKGTSVPLFDKPRKERKRFWEDETSIHPNLLLNKEQEMPKTKADLMQELFGSQRSDSFHLDAVASSNSLPDSSHMRSRMQQN